MEYEKLTNPEHYKSHAVTVEPISGANRSDSMAATP